MLSILLLLAAVVETPDAVPVHDGGICAGLSWIRLTPGEVVSVERGPDFRVLRFHGPSGETDNWWGVYSGNYAPVRGNGPVLLRRNRVAVRRATEDGEFRGYIAAKGNRQNHFFGSVFDDNDKDRAFFDRVDLGSEGQALCAKDRLDT